MIYTEDPEQPHVEGLRWVLDQLWKNFLFTNLKKCWFHQDEVCFLGYVVSSKGISMKAEKFEVMKDWPKSKSVRDIQVFLGFANFYWRFIQGFSRIAALLTSMLKTTNEPAPSRNDGSRSASSRNNDSRPASGRNEDDGEVDRFGGGVEHAKKSGKSKSPKSAKSQKSSKSRKSKSKKSKKPPKSGNSPNFDAKNTGPSFLTPGAKEAFNHLQLAFTKAPIL